VRYPLLPILLILTALPACDNVEWAGADVEIVPPPPPSGALPVEPDVQAFAQFGLPTGTVLFHLIEGEEGDRLIPVAEVSGNTLRTLRRPAGVSPQAYEKRFRETVLPPGSEFTLYRRGAEVGTFVVQAEGPVTACGVPTAVGQTTTVAAAAGEPEFLAFREGLAPEVVGEYSPPQITGSIRTYASLVAEQIVLREGLPRPRSWVSAQRDLDAVEIMEGGHPEMAATYLVGDSLAVGPANEQGYSIFYLADYESRRGYSPIYTEVHDYRETGKAAPQFVDYLNWDKEEGKEVLVRVFGEDQSWYEVISQDEEGEWAKVWEGEPCE
jgi:hypothetical protein